MSKHEAKVVIGECRACREKKEIVHSIGGLKYCAEHSHMAPTRKQLQDYYNTDRRYSYADGKDSSDYKVRASGEH